MGYIKDVTKNHKQSENLNHNGRGLYEKYVKFLEWGFFIGAFVYYALIFDGSSVENNAPLSHEQKSGYGLLGLIFPFVGYGLIGCFLALIIVTNSFIKSRDMKKRERWPLILKGKFPKSWLN